MYNVIDNCQHYVLLHVCIFFSWSRLGYHQFTYNQNSINYIIITYLFRIWRRIKKNKKYNRTKNANFKVRWNILCALWGIDWLTYQRSMKYTCVIQFKLYLPMQDLHELIKSQHINYVLSSPLVTSIYI
jgi:hypothetical protein